MTSENLYEQILAAREPGLSQDSQEEAINSLRLIDQQLRNLSGIVGPQIGLQLFSDLVSSRFADFSIVAGLTAEELSEYHTVNLKPASGKVFWHALGTVVDITRFSKQAEQEANHMEWQALEEEFPPYAGRISLLEEVLKKTKGYKRRFYFSKFRNRESEWLISLFLNARGFYPTPEPLNTDYLAESEEMSKVLNLEVLPKRGYNGINPEQVMGVYLRGGLKVERQFSVFPHTPLDVSHLPKRVSNHSQSVETIEEMKWLLLPENKKALQGIRLLGEKGLTQVKEALATYQQDNSN
ncbi:MAG: hypothetical protein Q7R49_03465 [Candidatus Daviesbacteria bacterium]|nr:hypothetical protein [Candidatus Daviesbacteria bacterium]